MMKADIRFKPVIFNVVQVDHRWTTWNFSWFRGLLLRTNIENALEFTDLCAIQFRLVVNEMVSA